MGVKKIKISALPLADTLVGLYTIGVNALNKSVKVSLEFLKTAADKANDAATAANKAKTAAETATEAAKTATKNANTATEAANTAAKNATDKATAADTAAKNANTKADAADKAAGQDALQLRNSAPKLQRPGPPLRVNEDFVPASPEPEDLAQLDHARFPTGQRHPKRLPAVSAAAKPQDFLQPLPLRRHHQAPLHGQAVAVQYLLIVIHQKDNRQGIGFRLKFTGQLHPAVGGLQK